MEANTHRAALDSKKIFGYSHYNVSEHVNLFPYLKLSIQWTLSNSAPSKLGSKVDVLDRAKNLIHSNTRVIHGICMLTKIKYRFQLYFERSLRQVFDSQVHLIFSFHDQGSWIVGLCLWNNLSILLRIHHWIVSNCWNLLDKKMMTSFLFNLLDGSNLPINFRFFSNKMISTS